MRSSFIKILIAVISLALIGLVAVQVYWIDNAVKLKRARFEQNVNAALIDVSRGLERMETLEQLRNDRRLRQLFSRRGKHPGIDTLTSEQEGGAWRMVRKERTDTSESGMISHSRLVTREYVQGKEGRADLSTLEQLYRQLMAASPFRPFHERVDPERLDSLVRRSLRDRGITADHEFGVFGPFGHPLFFKDDASRKHASRMDKPAFTVRLFPNDLFRRPHTLRLHFPGQTTYLLSTMWSVLLSSAVLMLVIISAFSYTIFTILKQKKLSEIKNDLVGNMTHELKTPISTISLACEALGDPDVSRDEDSRRNFIRMIGEENKRLGVLVENVLRSAVLDKGEVKLQQEEVDLHELIGEAIRNIHIQVEEKQGKLNTNLEAEASVVTGDKVHLTNVVFNLLDNAIKYGGTSPEIEIRTRNEPGGVQVSVSDRGGGIRKEEQRKIFDRLYRVPTGNIHNVKGSGLGLSYVKVIVEKHGGSVSVDSTPGKGSTFHIFLPFKHQNKTGDS